jgi:hypothetical protein
MTLRKLALPALLIPTTGWPPVLLGASSVVEVLKDGDASPIGLSQELPIRALNHEREQVTGYVSSTATFVDSGRRYTTLTTERPDGSMRATDTLRMRMLQEKQVRWQNVNGPWTPLGWFGRFGITNAELLTSVVREHGGILPRSSTPTDILARALRIIISKEVTVSDATEAAAPKPATKRAAKKTPAKKSATKRTAKPDAPARSMSRTVGNTLLPLFEKAGAKRESVALAKKLSNDEKLGKKDLQHLRDAVNEYATAARENKKESLASSLSAANRLVRRLARQA